MSSRIRLFLVTTFILIAIVIIAAILTTALHRYFTKHRIATAVGKFVTTSQGITKPSMNINVSIYVVGPSTLIKSLINAGINQALIRSTPINELLNLPNDSVVIVDWSLIKPSVVVNNTAGKITINLTNTIIHNLAIAISGGDVVGIYANGSDEGVVEFVLAYSWAVATKHRLIFYGRSSSDYLLIYPIIPVNIHEPVVVIVRWVKPWGLAIGPVYLSQLPTVIANMMKPTTTITTTAGNNIDPVQSEDPCYEEYSYYYSSNPLFNVYVTNGTTYIWIAPMFYQGPYYTGIPGYSDGNESYYWDTCLLASNYIFGIESPGVPINVIGYEAYMEKPTMYDNNGYEGYQVGAIDYYTGYQMYVEGVVNAFVGDGGPASFSPSSWNPPPMSSTSNYEISSSFNITLPPGTSESIYTSQGPVMDTSLPNVPLIIVSNLTWVFNVSYSADDQVFPNAFEDISPATIYIPSLPTESFAAFPIDFENYAVTSQELCSYYAYQTITYQTIWVKAWWVIDVIPSSSSTVNLPSTVTTWTSINTPSNSYVSGVSLEAIYVPCLVPS